MLENNGSLKSNTNLASRSPYQRQAAIVFNCTNESHSSLLIASVIYLFLSLFSQNTLYFIFASLCIKRFNPEYNKTISFSDTYSSSFK